MKQQMIKRLLVIIWGCFCLQMVTCAQVGVDKPAYVLYDNAGKAITYSQLIKQLEKYDVVFLGEMHNCPITHWLEFEITRSLYHIHKDKLMLGEEMMESDNQLILNEYLQRKISYDRFEEEARLWPNYSTDYSPVVYFAKENKIPFIATNVPRRYANAVKNGGLEVLDSLSDEAKRYIAPLPISFNYDEKESEAAFSMMNMMGGQKSGDNYKLAQAQAVKDATMGWFIAHNMKDKFLHINGSYHSDWKNNSEHYRKFIRSSDITSVSGRTGQSFRKYVLGCGRWLVLQKRGL